MADITDRGMIKKKNILGKTSSRNDSVTRYTVVIKHNINARNQQSITNSLNNSDQKNPAVGNHSLMFLKAFSH